MTPREHARLARQLITACGGLEKAAKACRVSKTELSRYQSPHEGRYMPVDVLRALECCCGRPIYSGALVALFDAPKADGCLRDRACELSETTLQLQGRVRIAYDDGALCPRELDEIAEAERRVEETLVRHRASRLAIEQNHAPRLLAV
jgi:hypothetical protein